MVVPCHPCSTSNLKVNLLSYFVSSYFKSICITTKPSELCCICRAERSIFGAPGQTDSGTCSKAVPLSRFLVCNIDVNIYYYLPCLLSMMYVDRRIGVTTCCIVDWRIGVATCCGGCIIIVTKMLFWTTFFLYSILYQDSVVLLSASFSQCNKIVFVQTVLVQLYLEMEFRQLHCCIPKIHQWIFFLYMFLVLVNFILGNRKQCC